MPTDPSIILDAGNFTTPPPGAQSIMSMWEFAQAVKAQQKQEATTNTLKQIFTNPASVDPVTGMPTNKAVQEVMAVDPELGLKVRDQTLEAQVKAAEIAHSKTEVGKNNWDFMTQVAGIGYDAYDEAKKAGKSEPDAVSAGQAARNAAAENSGGVVGDDIIAGITGRPFDPAGAKALASANKERVEAQKAQAGEDVAYANAGLTPPSAVGVSQASSDPFSDFAAKLIPSENSTGNPSAKNPNSTATGDGQFLNQTWIDNVRVTHPEWKTLTDNQLLALRSDPELSKEVTVDYAKKNATTLADAGVPVTGANLAAAHKLGPGDAEKVIQADPSTPLPQILSPKVIAANPQLANQTAGQYMGGLTSQFGASPISAEGEPAEGRVPITGGKGWQERMDLDTNKPIRYNVNRGIATDLSGNPIPTPKNIGNIPTGNARSPAAFAVQKFAQEHPDATADDIANFAADYQRKVVGGTADVKAEAAGLTNLGKMRASVEQAEGNANRESDLVLSLADKGTAKGGPSMLNRWQQSIRTGVFNDPNVTAFQTAVESFKNEYVKVLSTTGGMSGGMSSDAARREADAYINPNLTEDQLKANIAVMKQSMKNRTAAINKAYEDQKGRVSDATKGTDGAADAAPKVLHYDAKGNLVSQ